jgi:amino acid adenylation domain-containing protein
MTRLEDHFLAAAADRPEALAVVDGDACKSYGQLLDEAARLAGAIHHLCDRSGRHDGVPRVGLLTERNADAYSAILAVLLAGGAFVPINPGHPGARIRRTMELADLSLIIADDAGALVLDQLEPGQTQPPVLLPWRHRPRRGWLGAETVDTTQPRYHHDRDVSSPTHGHEPRIDTADDLAYLLFTSGTTGDPKGVPISHGNAVSFIDQNLAHYRVDDALGPGHHCSQTFDLTFDLSVFDLFMTLGSGACVHPMRSLELMTPVEFVNHHQLTFWFSVPSVASLQVQRAALIPAAMPSLRTSLFCGEALTTAVARAWAESAPNSIVENLYGPTELTIACTRHRLDRSGGAGESCQSSTGIDLVPIGRPFSTMTAVIVDEAGGRVEDGAPGELCLDGPQRFGGYWRSPEKTAEKSLNLDGRTFYRTGDLVRRDPDGVIHFIGRADNQVQVLGHRVELGEVEAALRSIDGVVDAVAVALPIGSPATTHLGAAVTLAGGANGRTDTAGSDLSGRMIRRLAADRLPSYQRPRRVEVLKAFPLNVNGKIDRRAVAEMFESPAPEPVR